MIFNLFNGNAFLNIVILYYLLMRQDVWFVNHLVCPSVSSHGQKMSQMTQFYIPTHFDVFCVRIVLGTGGLGAETPGGTRIFGRTGMCCSNGSLFYKKSLNMGPVFYKKILEHGSTFLTELKFSGFRMAKIAKCLKMGLFFKKNP